MNRTVSEIARAAGSALAGVVLLVGVPLLLVRGVGWPLPTSIPELDTVRRALRAGISDEFVVNALAVVAWVVWAQLVGAVIAEVVAVGRGRQAVRLPIAPGLQGLAEHLVAAILAFGSLAQPAVAIAAPVPIQAVATPRLPAVDHIAWRSAVHADTKGPVTSGTSPRLEALATLTVRRHDTYWAIAERVLGDGVRWREIRDLNAGRVLPDGTVIPGDDDTLHTGWVLLLPADATMPSEPGERLVTRTPQDGAADTNTGAPTVVVEQGDSLWTLADTRLEHELGRDPTDWEIAPYWNDVIDANADRYVQPGNANLIHPGQEIVLPGTGIEPPPPPSPPIGTDVELPALDGDEAGSGSALTVLTTLPTPTPELAEPPAEPPAAEESVVETTEAGSDDDDGISAGRLALGGLASVALAVGLKRALARRRRRFTQEHGGQTPAPTPEAQRHIHRAVVVQADDDHVQDLQATVASLAASLAGSGSARRPRIVRHGSAGCEVMPDVSDPHAPTGWDSTPDGRVWTRVEPASIDDGQRRIAPAPLLVTMGQPDDDAQLYLDLESDGRVALTGDPEAARNLARSILTELALSPLADNLRVIVVGDLADVRAETLDHVTVATSWDEVAADITSWAKESHEAVVENGWPNAFVGRASAPDHDALVAVAVVADSPPPDEVSLALTAAWPSTVSVVVAGDWEGAASEIHCADDALRLIDLRIECLPQSLTADELGEVCTLLDATEIEPPVEPADETGNTDSEAQSGASAVVAPTTKVPACRPDEPPQFDVLVRLLGDITVEGGRPLKPKATSVVAYLAMNRAVTTDRLVEACWYGVDGVSHAKRLRDTMTEIRGALGSHHFPANRSGTYSVGVEVGTDLDLFDWHVRRAASLEPIDAARHLSDALALVTGVPFSYPGGARASFGWVDLEHHASTWEHQIGMAGRALAELVGKVRDPEAVITELRRLVSVNPFNTGPIAALMQALVATAQVRDAERVLSDHAVALDRADLGAPADELVEVLCGE